MRDPHVERLRYNLQTNETTRFEAPPPLETDTPVAHLRLEDGVLTAEMKDHHPTEASARAVVDPFLRAWELHICLEWGRGAIRFEFERAEIVDRNPPPPGEPVTVALAASAGSFCFVGGARDADRGAQHVPSAAC
jgi:hypothetical protein